MAAAQQAASAAGVDLPFPKKSLVLIVGSTGNVGSKLTPLLASEDGLKVRAGMRDIAKALPGFPANVERVALDLSKADTMAAAMKDVDVLVIIPPFEEHMQDETKALVECAKVAKVKHICRMSGLGASKDAPISVGKFHGLCDEVVKASGIPFTIVHPNNFFQNMAMHAGSITQTNSFFMPCGTAKVSSVAVEDIAAEIAAIVKNVGAHASKEYSLSGPEALSWVEVAAVLAGKIGHAVSYVDVAPEKARESMEKNGMPKWMVDALLELYGMYKSGNAANVVGQEDFERIVGRKTSNFAAWVDKNKGMFEAPKA